MKEKPSNNANLLFNSMRIIPMHQMTTTPLVVSIRKCNRRRFSDISGEAESDYSIRDYIYVVYVSFKLFSELKTVKQADRFSLRLSCLLVFFRGLPLWCMLK